MPCRSTTEVHEDGTLTQNGSVRSLDNNSSTKKNIRDGHNDKKAQGTKNGQRFNVKDDLEEKITSKDHKKSESDNTSDKPQKKTGICCSASDVQTEDSLTPANKETKSETNIDVVTNDDGNTTDENEDDDDDNDIVIPSEQEIGGIYSNTKKRKKSLHNISENPKYYVDDESKGKSTMSITFPKKKGKYSLTENIDDTEGPIARPMPKRSPKKKSLAEKTMDRQRASSVDYESVESEEKPKKKKGKKKKDIDEDDEAMEMRSVYENQIASLQQSPTAQVPPLSSVDLIITGPPTVEMEEDLLENAEEERRKNKHRLREKRRMEKEYESPLKKPPNDVEVVYESAQKEIDKVLGPRKGETYGVEKLKKRPNSKEKKRKDKRKSDDELENGDSHEDNPPSDTLEEARVKIHRLLDDAFSLISQSRSSMGNKVHPVSQQSSVEKESPRSHVSHRSHSSIEAADQVTPPVEEEKKHTPMYVERSHGPYDKSGLISWSPYRASDDTALISLPNSQTNLNNVAPQRDPITSTTVFSENLPSSLQPNYYTTLPGEPIILTTKELDPKHPSTAGNGGSDTKSKNPNQTPYYGMSSYHELPVSSVIPNSSSMGDNRYNGRNIYTNDLSNGGVFNSGYDGEYLKPHSAPGNGRGSEMRDEVDVIKHSVLPGASPQPLIHSLREELMNLSRKKGADPRHAGDNDLHVSSKDRKLLSHVQDEDYRRNNRNRHMKTEL